VTGGLQKPPILEMGGGVLSTSTASSNLCLNDNPRFKNNRLVSCTLRPVRLSFGGLFQTWGGLFWGAQPA